MEEYYQNVFAGLNTNSEFALADPEATEASNAKIDNDGSLMSRLGRSHYNTSVTCTSEVISVYRWEKESKVIASCGAHLYLVAEGAGHAFSSIKNSLTPGGLWEFLHYQDQLYMCDGVNTNLKYDGTNVVTWGIETPSVGSMTATATGSDSFGGDYKYKVSYVVNNAQEGNASTNVDVDNTGDTFASIELANIPTGEADTVARNIYRTIDGGAIYYYLAQIADNATPTYTDTTADSGLTTSKTAPSDKGAPPTIKFAVLHNNFVFAVKASDPKRLIFSTQTDVDIFPAANYWDFSRDITGLCAFQGVLWVFTQTRIYPLYGNNKTDFQRDMISMYSPGTVAHRSIVKTESGIYYLAKDGVYNFNGTSIQLVSARIAGDNNDEIADILDSYKANACADYFKGKYYLSVTTSGTVNNETYVFDTVANRDNPQLPTGHWSICDFGMNDFSVWEDGTFFGAGAAGYVYQLAIGNVDVSSAIAFSYKTKQQDWRFPGRFKRARECILWGSLSTDTLRITFDVDNGTQTWYKDLADIGSSLAINRFSIPTYITGRNCKVTFSGSLSNQLIIKAFLVRFLPLRRR